MDRNTSFSVLIPAAGVSQRFKDIGIHQPKHELEFYWTGTGKRCSMLEHIITPLLNLNCDIVVGVRETPNEYITGVTYLKTGDTGGQADTVHQLASYAGPANHPVLVLNCDAAFGYPLETFVSQCMGTRAYVLPILAGAMVTDGRHNEAFSYVDGYPFFSAAMEKVPISRWAMTGAYYFRSVNLLKDALRRHLHGHYVHEAYLSALFGKDPFTHSLAVYTPPYQWHCWGTPQDLVLASGVSQFDPEVLAALNKVI